MWLVRKADSEKTYIAEDLTTLVAWCRAGRVKADDLIKPGDSGAWTRADGKPELAASFGAGGSLPPITSETAGLRSAAITGTTETTDEKISLDLTSMMDLTFILLIFLMLVATPAFQKGLDVDLPSSAAAGQVENTDITVSIDSAGVVYIDSREVLIDQLASSLQAAVREVNFARLILRSDGDVTHKKVVQIMDAINAAGISDITIATSPSLEADR